MVEAARAELYCCPVRTELKSFIISRPLLIASYFILRHGRRGPDADGYEAAEEEPLVVSPFFLHPQDHRRSNNYL